MLGWNQSQPSSRATVPELAVGGWAQTMGARWIGVDEAATALAVSTRTLQNMANRGELGRRRVGRRSEYLVETPARDVAGENVACEDVTVAPAEHGGARMVTIGARLGELEARISGLESEVESQMGARPPWRT